MEASKINLNYEIPSLVKTELKPLIEDEKPTKPIDVLIEKPPVKPTEAKRSIEGNH